MASALCSRYLPACSPSSGCARQRSTMLTLIANDKIIRIYNGTPAARSWSVDCRGRSATRARPCRRRLPQHEVARADRLVARPCRSALQPGSSDACGSSRVDAAQRLVRSEAHDRDHGRPVADRSNEGMNLKVSRAQDLFAARGSSCVLTRPRYFLTLLTQRALWELNLPKLLPIQVIQLAMALTYMVMRCLHFCGRRTWFR